MKRGGTILVSTAILAVAACGSDGKLQVRSLPNPIGPNRQPLSVRVAEGQAQLRLGNVALALESFRKANRDDPNNIEALAGMAVCYDQMGRFDVSRRYYEAALAIEPANTEVLAMLAASLQGQGLAEEATKVRREIAMRSAAATTSVASQIAERTPAPAPVVSQLPVRIATPVPAPEVVKFAAKSTFATPNVPAALVASRIAIEEEREVEPDAADIPRPALAATEVQVANLAGVPVTMAVTTPADQPVRVEMTVEAAETASAPPGPPAPELKEVALGPSVTIKLPPARRVDAPPASPPVAMTKAAQEQTAASKAAPTAPPPAPESAPAPLLAALPEHLKLYARPVPKPTFTELNEPRLERVSMGEIALITAARPIWRATMVDRTAQSSRVRFVPLREASTLPVKVRLLNAARVDRLAARTQAWLAARGWQRLGIGDARSTRQASVILYPADKLWLARRLRAQFGFATQRATVTQVTVLLGSDAARHPALRKGGA